MRMYREHLHLSEDLEYTYDHHTLQCAAIFIEDATEVSWRYCHMYCPFLSMFSVHLCSTTCNICLNRFHTHYACSLLHKQIGALAPSGFMYEQCLLDLSVKWFA